MSGWKKYSEKEKQKKRKVLLGFPWRGIFQTKEEIEAYFAGDKIQCLLCGKWYKKLSGAHLSHIHDMTDDEYRQRYGLPWSRGLTAETLKKRRSEIAKQLIKEGRIHPFDGKDEEILRKSKMNPQRPPQPYATDLRRMYCLTAHGRTVPWQRKDYEAILNRMQEQQRLLRDVCQDPDLPGESAWKIFVEKHPEFAEKAQQIHYSLPYSVQLQSNGNVSPQFQIDCQRLRDQGMLMNDIGKTLGVSAITIRRTLRKAGRPPAIKTVTIEQMHQLAERRGGKCLSATYINNRTKLLWECEQGHQWEARSAGIQQGQWCPVCAGHVKGTIEKMRRLAERRGGKCLSTTYINSKTNLLWECEQGHQWEAKPNGIQQGQWCPVCAGHVKGTIEKMRQLAEHRGGKCLSTVYINGDTKLLWECAQGHQWAAKPNNISAGTWCPVCAGHVKGTIEKMRRLAERRGGKCLSTVYINGDTKLLWECAQGHQWAAKPNNISAGTWCPSCAGTAKGTLEEMRQLAERRGGKCLSTVYINGDTKLLWECAQGHQWKTAPSNIKHGHWCPHCANNRRKGTLEEMRQLAEHRGGKCLSTAYINNSTKLLWECEQGHQWEARPSDIKHEHWCPYCTGKAKKTIKEMQQLAKRHGGRCLSETYINRHTKLLWECKQGHQWETRPYNIRNGHWCPYCGNNRRKRTIEEMRQLAKHHGGRCLSETYINNRTKLLWECEQKHQWKARPYDIRSGHWCPYCADRIKKTIEDMRQLASRRNGRCLSETYINNRTKLLWECAKGHQWQATPNNIKNGDWCPHCAGNIKKTIEEMQQLAKRHGGRCLSPTYTNNRTKLVWQCAQGHQWKTTPKSIIRGRWCPVCARSKRKGTREKKR